MVFEEIVHRSMHDFSFSHPNMPVYFSDFALFEGQWTDVIIMPWMLSVLTFLGPDQLCSVRTVGKKLGLQL